MITLTLENNDIQNDDTDDSDQIIITMKYTLMQQTVTLTKRNY